MIQKFAAKVLSFYEVRNTRVTEYLHLNKTIYLIFKVTYFFCYMFC